MSKPAKVAKTPKLKDPKAAMKESDKLDPVKVKAARVAAFKPKNKSERDTRRQNAISNWTSDQPT